MTKTLVCSEAEHLRASHAFGVLSDAESQLYQGHLRTCQTCEDKDRALARTLPPLGLAAPSRTPPPSLRDRVLARCREPSTSNDAEASKPARPFVFVEADATPWEPTDVPGVERRLLFEDPSARRETCLYRMAPETVYPPHRHADVEECYVLQGDLCVGDVTMHAGDYQRAERDSVHGPQSTKDGCLLLIVASTCDERLSSV